MYPNAGGRDIVRIQCCAVQIRVHGAFLVMENGSHHIKKGKERGGDGDGAEKH